MDLLDLASKNEWLLGEAKLKYKLKQDLNILEMFDHIKDDNYSVYD